MSAGASGFPSGESMNRGQIGPGADARRPRVGPSTVRATSHRHRIGKRMPCATVRAMQPDSTRAGDTDRRPPSGGSHVAGCPSPRMPGKVFRGMPGRCVPRVSPEIARPVFAPRMPRKPPAPPPMPGHGPGWIGGAGRMQSGKPPFAAETENPPIVFYPCSTIV